MHSTVLGLNILVKCTLFLSNYNKNWNVSINISKNFPISNFTKMSLIDIRIASCVQTDGQTYLIGSPQGCESA
jgi:hypothetical protein